MKQLKYTFLALFAAFAFAACEDDDTPMFTLRSTDEVAFVNNFAAEYIISEPTADNVAERFIWNTPDFGTPTAITYQLQASADAEFSTFEVLGTTPENNFPVTVEQLLGFARDMGLDGDPVTTLDTGSPNNLGQVYFRVLASTEGNENALADTSGIQALNIRWLEETVEEVTCPAIYIVGAAAVDAGWNWDSPIELTACATEGVYSSYLNLTNDAFRFFTEEGTWESGLNFPHYVAEGYTIDDRLEDAMDGDNNFSFTGTPGVYELVVNDNTKTITLTEAPSSFYLVGSAISGSGWNWDAPTVSAPMSSPGVYSVTTEILNGDGNENAFRFFTEESNWDSGINYPGFENRNFTIDEDLVNAEDGDSNFKFMGETGTYTITVDLLGKVITVE